MKERNEVVRGRKERKEKENLVEKENSTYLKTLCETVWHWR